MKSQFKHIWSIVCKKAVIDKDTNMLSILEVLERLDVSIKHNSDIVPTMPTGIAMDFEIISFWHKQTNENEVVGESRILVLSPNKKELIASNIKFLFSGNSENARTIIKVNGFPLDGHGEYIIRIQQKVGKEFETVAELPLQVFINTEKQNKMDLPKLKTLSKS